MEKILLAEKAYFRDNQEALAASHPGKFLLIKGRQLPRSLRHFDEGVAEGVRRFPEARAFLVRGTDEPDEFVANIPALAVGVRLSCPS